MKITITENNKSKLVDFKGKTIADLIHSFDYSTESYVALRDGVPITVLDKVKKGDSIKLMKVVTGA